MAAVASTGDQAADLLQKLSLGSQNKTLDIPEPTKKPSVDSGHATNGQIQSCDRSLTPLLTDFMDPTMCYLPSGYPSPAYYYGGYDGSGHEWDDYSRYVNPDVVEMTPGVYGENGSFLYHHSYGYAPYGPYSPAASPVPNVGHDGQFYGAQHYQYPAPYFQPVTPGTGPYSNTATVPKSEITNSTAADQASLSVESGNGNTNDGGVKGNNGSEPLRSAYPNSSFMANGSYGRGALPGGFAASGYQDPRFSFDGILSPVPWLDGPIVSDVQHRPVTSSSLTSSVPNGNGVPATRNQNLPPNSHLMVQGLHHPRPMSGMSTANGYMNRMYPNKLYGDFGNNFRSGFGFGSNVYDSRVSGRGWLPMDNKFKPRGRGNGLFGYGIENMDGLNELNRGPRAKSSKNKKGFAPAAVAVKGLNIPLTGTKDVEKKSNVISDQEQYNRTDFPEKYTDAKFFVIKSYSEDDVHKSIKYNVWASTPNGNKKLDDGYQESKQESGKHPVFLFFSVNTSGQFVGVAEMVGPVDFSKNLEYWQQDKWIGCFPVKWHIVKDVPNSLLKHITLENNEHKPVTNSRDTQEVKLEQGLQMLKIFKEHSSRQCILDDFDFYEDREKRIQEKKAKQQQFQKQLWEGKHVDEKNKEVNGLLKSQNSSDVNVELVKESAPAVQMNGSVNVTENGFVGKSVDVLKAAKPVPLSENILSNDVANGF